MKRKTLPSGSPCPRTAALAVLAVGVLLGSAGAARAAVVGPYRVDSFTLHLWHFDESADSGEAADAAEFGTIPLILQGPATLGNPSATGFGGALATTNGAYADGGTQLISSFTWSDGASRRGDHPPGCRSLAPPNQYTSYAPTARAICPRGPG